MRKPIHYLLLLNWVCTSSLGFQIHCSRRYLSRPFGGSLGSTSDESSTLDWNKLSTASSASEPQDFIEIANEEEDDDGTGNVNIPPGGYSVSDQIDSTKRDRFVTELVPIDGLRGVAQLYTSPVSRGSFEPVRYLIATTPVSPTTRGINSTFSSPTTTMSSKLSSSMSAEYVLIDVPPYSPQLVTAMKSFMGRNGSLKALLLTSRDNIHYDDMPGVYVARRADLDLWRKEFPKMEIVSYRLDTPRDCRALVTQVLDGYGPFAMLDNGTFAETGSPLTYDEWDVGTAEGIMMGNQSVPEVIETKLKMLAEEYSLESIRRKEQDKSVLAVYTPGHTYGSVSYVFPHQSLVASGFTLPVEDTRFEENLGDASTGPALDCRGYITTSRAGIRRQMESARRLVDEYIDRFKVVLPSRGDPLFLEDDLTKRTAHIKDIVDQFDRIGQIYEQLGITSASDE